MLETKKKLFEYLVFLLDQWYKEGDVKLPMEFTKLRLQKILFLAAATNTIADNCPLLNIFDRFYALPYGPVELDIYDAMNNNVFGNITFFEKRCDYSKLDEAYFDDLDVALKADMCKAIDDLKSYKCDYLRISISDLVNITHKWTSWQVSMNLANILGARREAMSTEDICNSKIKAFV